MSGAEISQAVSVRTGRLNVTVNWWEPAFPPAPVTVYETRCVACGSLLEKPSRAGAGPRECRTAGCPR
jgi:hypothetical protein